MRKQPIMPLRSIFHTAYSLIILCCVLSYFYNNNSKQNDDFNNDPGVIHHLKNISLIFDTNFIRDTFNYQLITLLNHHKFNDERFLFKEYVDNDLLDIGIFIMLEQHKGLNLIQKKPYLVKLKEKMNQLIILTLRYGEFPNLIKELSLEKFKVVELLYKDQIIINDSKRNEEFIEKLFQMLDNV